MIQEDTRTLNQGQQAAADGFFQFLFSDEREMRIDGPGGVGKTFLMGYLIDVILPRYLDTCKLMGIKPEYDSVVMTATTNKAAEVLGLATKRPTETIFSFLGLIPKADHDTGVTTLKRGSKWMVHERKIIFVDESSLVDSVLDIAIKEGNLKCKIVFVGDRCQLTPVREKLSPIYTRPMLSFDLLEPMRNSGQPALLAVCQQLRNTVETGIFHPIRVIPGVIDHVDDAEMQAQIDQTFQVQTRDSRILAWSNDRVTAYNDHIRDMRGLPIQYQVGEILVNNASVKLSTKRSLSVEEEVEITHLSELTQMMVIEEGGTTFEGREIDKTVELEVRFASIKTRLGEIFTGVPLPEDRNHYNELLRYYARIRNYNRHYFMKERIPDLRPRDAATVHKSQGSTYDTTFIDIGNLSRCHQPDQMARLLYVAFTRSKNRVILYGDMASKYGGLIN